MFAFFVAFREDFVLKAWREGLAQAPLPLEVQLGFDSNIYLAESGFGGPEQWGRWTIDETCILSFINPPLK
jgi:hypothetical protein